MTITLTVQIDIHEGQRASPARIARAVARVITHATEVDIAGAEILDTRIGQVSVRVARPLRNGIDHG